MHCADSGRGAHQVSRQEASGPARPVLLLVPGAWHGPWVWEKVQPELTARGWLVQTMDLPSTALARVNIFRHLCVSQTCCR
jgi:hypothetical protein